MNYFYTLLVSRLFHRLLVKKVILLIIIILKMENISEEQEILEFLNEIFETHNMEFLDEQEDYNMEFVDEQEDFNSNIDNSNMEFLDEEEDYNDILYKISFQYFNKFFENNTNIKFCFDCKNHKYMPVNVCRVSGNFETNSNFVIKDLIEKHNLKCFLCNTNLFSIIYNKI